MNTTLTASQLAEILGKKIWNGNGQERIYFNNVGYNTKKMTTKAFIYIDGGEIKASAYVTCANQPQSWCQQRAEEAKETMLEIVAEKIADLPAAEMNEPAPAAIPEAVQTSEINLGNSDYAYPSNFYNGCGSYYLAIAEGKIVASVNFSCSMEKNNLAEREALTKKLMENNIEAEVIAADGSGCTFFGRDENQLKNLGVCAKVYYVPDVNRGGRHKNIELQFN